MMSNRKRAFSEVPQSQSSITPTRYAPSTPHAIRALQERSSAKRSVRSARTLTRTARNGDNTNFEVIRPDGSIRNILKQFAKVTAPVTKKRISTPLHQVRGDDDKENALPEDDSIIINKPRFSLNIQDSIEEEDDSELLVAPTPSALPDDSDSDGEQPTITFQNMGQQRKDFRPVSDKIDRRKSMASLLDEQDDSEHDRAQDDYTIMTERGRRALSEEATGRLSRYSFGSLRMSEFGSELEIRRVSDRDQKLTELGHDDYGYFNNDGNTSEIVDDTLQQSPKSPTEILNEDSVHFPGFGNETFNLEMPDDDAASISAQARSHGSKQPVRTDTALVEQDVPADVHSIEGSAELATLENPRQRTTLEKSADISQKSRRQHVKMTCHGTMVPSLPSSLVRRVATEVQTKQGKRKPKFGRDHIKALEQATEWFFEQVGEDLAAYSSHGRRRKRVDADDVLLLMKRQRVLSRDGDLDRLAKEWLPEDVVEDLDLADKP